MIVVTRKRIFEETAVTQSDPFTPSPTRLYWTCTGSVLQRLFGIMAECWLFRKTPIICRLAGQPSIDAN